MNDRVVDKLMYLSACVGPYCFVMRRPRLLIQVKIDGDLRVDAILIEARVVKHCWARRVGGTVSC